MIRGSHIIHLIICRYISYIHCYLVYFCYKLRHSRYNVNKSCLIIFLMTNNYFVVFSHKSVHKLCIMGHLSWVLSVKRKKSELETNQQQRYVTKCINKYPVSEGILIIFCFQMMMFLFHRTITNVIDSKIGKKIQ